MLAQEGAGEGLPAGSISRETTRQTNTLLKKRRAKKKLGQRLVQLFRQSCFRACSVIPRKFNTKPIGYVRRWNSSGVFQPASQIIEVRHPADTMFRGC
jgi:hypothetical protein